MANDPTLAGIARIDSLILTIRGQRVMLDSDLARIYGVLSKRLNEQVRRNLNRFPRDFAFQLTRQEFANLKSQFATSSFHGGKRKLPWAFTDRGAIMLSGVLDSPIAVAVSVALVRAAVRQQRLFAVGKTVNVGRKHGESEAAGEFPPFKSSRI